MKLLFDENLSPRLASAFQGDFPGSTHVHLVGLGSTLDEEIWRYARENGYTLVSKDADFHERGLIAGYPPKVIWVRRGNIATGDIEIVLRDHREAIERLEADSELSVLVV